MQGLFAITDRTTDDDKAITDESVHKCRVLIPALLITYLARGIPARAVN